MWESLTLSHNDLNLYSAVFNFEILVWSSLSSRLNWPPVRPFSVQAPHPKKEASVLNVTERFSLAIGAKLDGMSSKVYHLDLVLVLWKFYQSYRYVLLMLQFWIFQMPNNEVYLVVMQELPKNSCNMPNCNFRCNQSIFTNIQDSLLFLVR